LKTGRGVRIVCRLSPSVFSLYTRYLTEDGLRVFEDFRLGEKVICIV